MTITLTYAHPSCADSHKHTDVHTHVCIYVLTYIHKDVYTHTHTHTHAHTHRETHRDTHTHTCMRACMHAQTRPCRQNRTREKRRHKRRNTRVMSQPGKHKYKTLAQIQRHYTTQDTFPNTTALFSRIHVAAAASRHTAKPSVRASHRVGAEQATQCPCC